MVSRPCQSSRAYDTLVALVSPTRAGRSCPEDHAQPAAASDRMNTQARKGSTMFLRLLVMVIGLALLGTIHAQQEIPKPLAPTEAARTMIVPEGFSVTLFAGEPDVRQPIGFCIDDRGRLWVAEAYNYPNHSQTGRDRILIFEDADGDGRFDKRTIFYDKLNYVTGIEVGFGGAWIMSPPNTSRWFTAIMPPLSQCCGLMSWT